MHRAANITEGLRRWTRAAFRLDARSLAVFRMALGTILCCDAILRTRDFRIMFSPDGLFPLPVLRGYQNDPCVWSLCFLSDALPWQAVVLSMEGLAGLALAVGFRTRATVVVAWMAAVSVLRRTAPAANAGDAWLTTLLFWSLFLPLGEVWSMDARRRRTAEGRPPGQIWAAPLVLQIAAVYFAAGLAKCGGSWLSGDAVAHALSVHDHGTPLGERLASFTWLSAPLSWFVLALELLGPAALILLPHPVVRLSLVVLFTTFHIAVSLLMTVGLFAPIGLAAWSAILPGFVWDRLMPERPAASAVPRRATTAFSLQAIFGATALAVWLHAVGPWNARPLPTVIASIANLASLDQRWKMFGDVPRQWQWVYGRAELADGRMVDLLRGGRPLDTVRPQGGFSSLHHHRWHKLFWQLPNPPMRVFSPAIASAIARDWNARHGPSEQVRSLEIRSARLPTAGADATLHELLVATWPDRGRDGTGNLERFLESPSVRDSSPKSSTPKASTP